MARNWYAIEPFNEACGEVRYCEVHLFPTKRERDGFVRLYPVCRPVRDKEAMRLARDFNKCVMHGPTRLPRSWDWEHRWYLMEND